MPNRWRVYWMNEKDDIILEAMEYCHPVAIAPTPLYWNIENTLSEELNLGARTNGGFSLNTLRNRVDKLIDLGLIEVKRDKGRYMGLTEEGRLYLRGELNVATLENDE